MIRISVHLISAVDGRVQELARMDISNSGETNHIARGHYDGQTYVGRDKSRLDKGAVSKHGRVENWERERFHVWNLVFAMLAQMGYTQGRGK